MGDTAHLSIYTLSRKTILLVSYVLMYSNMAWNPAEIDYVTLIGNIIVIAVQYLIFDIYGSSIYILRRDSKQESESEDIAQCVYWDIFICPKASSIAFASAENMVASSLSRAENTFFLAT